MVRAGNLKNQHDYLEFILRTLESVNYEDSNGYIIAKKEEQISRAAGITPVSYKATEGQSKAEQYKSTIRSECLYYLSKYGTPEKQIEFYERNNQYEQAYKYIYDVTESYNFIGLLFSRGSQTDFSLTSYLRTRSRRRN